MQKTFLQILFASMLLLIPCLAQAKEYRVDIDDASRVEAYIKLGGDPSPLVNGMNTIDMGSESYLRIIAKPGVLITEATKVDDYYDEESPIPVQTENGVNYVDFSLSFPEDEWVRIRTSASADARSASCTVTIDNPAAVVLSRKATESVIELAAGENTVKFDPANEPELLLVPAGKPLYSVLLNGDPLTADYSYTIPVVDGDRLDITANFPDKDCKVRFNITGTGAEDFIQEVDVDGRPEFNWKAEDFTVKAGSELAFKSNTTEFEVLDFKVNGAPMALSNPTRLLITEDTEISASIRKYASFEMTVNVDDPAKVHIFRGYSYNKDELTLQAGENTVEITRTTPIISLVPADGCYINTLVIGDYEYAVDELQRSPVLVGSLTDGDVLTVTTATIVRDKKAMVYVENLEAAKDYFKVLRADQSVVENIAEGYNELAFYDRDNAFRFETGGPVTAYFYVNGIKAEPAPGSYNYTPELADGDVVKVFFGEAPASHTLTVDIHESLASAVKLVFDRIAEQAAVPASATLFHNTEVKLVPATDAKLTVTLDDEPLAPVDGTYSFVMTADRKLKVASESSGIEGIEAAPADEAVYNLQGVRLDRTLDELPAGVYIVGGRKVVK